MPSVLFICPIVVVDKLGEVGVSGETGDELEVGSELRFGIARCPVAGVVIRGSMPSFNGEARRGVLVFEPPGVTGALVEDLEGKVM